MPEKLSQEAYVKRLLKIKPTIRLIETYLILSRPTRHVCLVCTHGKDTAWLPLPANLLSGQGCPKCAGRGRGNKRSLDSWQRGIDKANGKDRYQLLDAPDGAIALVKVLHTRCGVIWKTRANDLVYGRGKCPRCNGKNFSQVSLRWLDLISKKHRKVIRHAGNGGEYRIPGTRLRVDGFHKASNTVFEFYGDASHGNPKVFKPEDKPWPYSDKTASELYAFTTAREEKLRALGYNIVTIWQKEFKDRIKALTLI